MDYRSNVTYLTFGGHVGVHKYGYLYFVLMFTVYMLIISSNVTIVSVIIIHKNLRPMYIFIAALLINSVLFSTAIYPKLLVDFLSVKQIISYPACLFQWFSYYWLGGSDFLLLSFMAYDRYVSICNPLQYQTRMLNIIVNTFLVSAWILPACLLLVVLLLSAKKKICNFYLKGILCNSTVLTLHCVRSRTLNIYGLFLFVLFVILPVLFILFTYSRILVVSYRCRGVRRRAAQTCLPHLLVLINFSCFFAYDVLLSRLELNSPKVVSLIMALQVVIYHPLFNPIIYGLKMRKIYDHLKKLFCRMWWGRGVVARVPAGANEPPACHCTNRSSTSSGRWSYPYRPHNGTTGTLSYPQRGSQAPRQICWRCGWPGHLRRECPLMEYPIVSVELMTHDLIPLSSESKEKPAFSTPYGLHQFPMLPFGVFSAPATIQWLIDRVLWLHAPYAAAYLDEVIIHSTT
ncbi:LOW QUALITY PROTEIN: olfactory receptor 11A1-like [Spinachia spinachia]